MFRELTKYVVIQDETATEEVERQFLEKLKKAIKDIDQVSKGGKHNEEVERLLSLDFSSHEEKLEQLATFETVRDIAADAWPEVNVATTDDIGQLVSTLSRQHEALER